MTSTCQRCGGPADHGGLFCSSCECSCRGRDPHCPACDGIGAVPSSSAPQAAAKERVVALASTFMQDDTIAEAELAAHGIHPVTITHGDPETHEEAHLLFTKVPDLARRTAAWTATRGGNDYSTYLFAGPTAEQAALTFMTDVLAIAPRWWKITASAVPTWQ
jgi:hypothetical protein